MNVSLADYLSQNNIKGEMIEVAAKYYVSELSGDLIPKEMKRIVFQNAVDSDKLAIILTDLELSPKMRQQASLEFLSWAWQDPENRSNICKAFEGARSKLPVTEFSIAAIVVIYGMYLIAVLREPKNIKHSIKKTEEGIIEETTEIEYQTINSPLPALAKMFNFVGKSHKADE